MFIRSLQSLTLFSLISVTYLSLTPLFIASRNAFFNSSISNAKDGLLESMHASILLFALESEDAVINWDSIIHKNVRSKDGQDAGNVDAIEGDTVVITSEGDREEYNLPKSEVEGYNGAEVSLKITYGELKKYKV